MIEVPFAAFVRLTYRQKREKRLMADPFEFSRSQAPFFPTTSLLPAGNPRSAFISGVTSDATVAATSFGSWTAFEPLPSIPAQYNPYYSNATKWGDPTLSARWNARRRHLSVRSGFGLVGPRSKTPGARRWRCGRQKSRSRSRPQRQDRLPISPSISSRFPVIPPLRPAHTSPLPTARPRSSAATSRAFPGSAPSSRSISTTKSPTPRAIPDRSRTLSQTATISITP